MNTLYEQLKPYGFFYMEGSIPFVQAKRFLQIQYQLQRPDLIFRPLREVCYERMLSPYTSLYIEGFERFSTTGKPIGYFYDFYKATYLFSSQPSRLKIYGTKLTQKELLTIIEKFSFLKP
ncbi:hypothetical protein [Enterococcus durans]|uniref:hypothetical protein n=1 Tax=Enterococcus durans TaxID=53345 RepID=UPI001D09F67A|nr:hypothetical protein [Enterococcus durans]MCB8504597.1 hypothetical protein [Enterococcus durans]MCB8514375.1 hypothetical protein [Enterococcus durans]